MIRRALWLSAGMAMGAASSVSVMRRLRRKVDRLRPSRVGAEVTDIVGSLRSQIRAAATEGREAMREREAQLWAELDPKRPLRPPLGRVAKQ